MLKKGDKEIVSRAIAGVGIEVLTGRMMHTLSDGEKTKGNDCQSVGAGNTCDFSG